MKTKRKRQPTVQPKQAEHLKKKDSHVVPHPWTSVEIRHGDNKLFSPIKQQVSKAAPPPPRCSGTLYQVKKGDSLYKIAVAHGLTLEAILAANPQIENPNVIAVGQVVCVPHGHESLMEILNTLLTAEKIEVALYARGLQIGRA